MNEIAIYLNWEKYKTFSNEFNVDNWLIALIAKKYYE